MMKKYTTSDLYISSMLQANGAELDKVHRIGNKCWFSFKDLESCNSTVLEHWKGNISVNSKRFIEALKTLKSLVFEEMNSNSLPN